MSSSKAAAFLVFLVLKICGCLRTTLTKKRKQDQTNVLKSWTVIFILQSLYERFFTRIHEFLAFNGLQLWAARLILV